MAIIINGDLAVELIPKGTVHMAATQDVGQTTSFSIAYFDQNGQPMAATPTPDAPPSWSQSDPAVDTLTASADGNTATALGIAAGSETIEVDLAVGGQSFKATIDMVVNAVVPTQILASIGIVASPPV